MWIFAAELCMQIEYNYSHCKHINEEKKDQHCSRLGDVRISSFWTHMLTWLPWTMFKTPSGKPASAASAATNIESPERKQLIYKVTTYTVQNEVLRWSLPSLIFSFPKGCFSGGEGVIFFHRVRRIIKRWPGFFSDGFRINVFPHVIAIGNICITHKKAVLKDNSESWAACILQHNL